MSAATFQRLLGEFQAGQVEVGTALFNLEIYVPSSITTGFDAAFARLSKKKQKSERERIGPQNFPLDRPPYDPKTHELIAKVCLPFSEPPNSEFTLNGFAVIRKDRRIKAPIAKFKRLCNKAGASFPLVVRDKLVGYCPFLCRAPACWWIALLAYVSRITAYNRLGNYLVEHVVGNQTTTNPLVMSADLIERLKLNTDSPRWSEPVADPPLGKVEKEILIAMLELGATEVNNRRPAKDIGVKAGGKSADENTYKRPFQKLKQSDLVNSHLGSAGGYWLTERGKQIGESLRGISAQ